jgi:hypothetical protein
MPNPQAGGTPLVGCTRLLIQYVHSYPPYLEGVSSIRNLRRRHAMVTRDPPNMVCRLEQKEFEWLDGNIQIILNFLFLGLRLVSSFTPHHEFKPTYHKTFCFPIFILSSVKLNCHV